MRCTAKCVVVLLIDVVYGTWIYYNGCTYLTAVCPVTVYFNYVLLILTDIVCACVTSSLFPLFLRLLARSKWASEKRVQTTLCGAILWHLGSMMTSQTSDALLNTGFSHKCQFSVRTYIAHRHRRICFSNAVFLVKLNQSSLRLLTVFARHNNVYR